MDILATIKEETKKEFRKDSRRTFKKRDFSQGRRNITCF
jgi:hypothetical protein